ncbi:hypothetical protein LBMAG47_03870 [Planctomycetia bacterium]|nr:hypothetical protein LBMAG47_03870 [Planctomycetia bacterium]
MASSSRPTSPIAALRGLLTSAERGVLEATTGSALAKATQQEVQKLIKQTRELSDKWRGLHESQSRSNKRTKDRGAANARSREKHELFRGAVARLEARLAEFGGTVAATVKGVAARATGKAARQATHRSARAGLRAEMTQTAAALAKKPAALKPALKPATLKPAKSAPTPVVPAAAAGRKKSAGRTLVKPAKVASGKKLAAQGTGQLIGFDVAKQRKARAAATVARLKFDGQTTRRGGHMLARGQRSQARRDSRTR